MVSQMNYIVSEKAQTEDRIMNGLALLGTNMKVYNSLFDYAERLKDAYFDLYFKVKDSKVKKGLPVTKDELRRFRTIGEMEKMSLPKEVGMIEETKLIVEGMHYAGRKDKENNVPTAVK